MNKKVVLVMYAKSDGKGSKLAIFDSREKASQYAKDLETEQRIYGEVFALNSQIKEIPYVQVSTD